MGLILTQGRYEGDSSFSFLVVLSQQMISNLVLINFTLALLLDKFLYVTESN